jgi:lipopolysaccharide/colanic/teichoic acid biosynthesis glycosyltransferase
MWATLLLPAGVTSEASIYYKDEAELLDGAQNPDETYVIKVLPGKMYFNLKELKKSGFWHDIKVMFMTVFAVLGKDYKAKIDEPIDNLSQQKEQTEGN